jgi:hypothetical protein
MESRSCRICLRVSKKIGHAAIIEVQPANNQVDAVISSHYPLRETLIQQTGVSEAVRKAFLNDCPQRARSTLFHVWEPEKQGGEIRFKLTANFVHLLRTKWCICFPAVVH